MLIKAKHERTILKFYLPFEMDFTDADSSCKGTVENVDVYSLKIKTDGREVWLNKSFLVGVEV
jgi:hypothetical protein